MVLLPIIPTGIANPLFLMVLLPVIPNGITARNW